MEDEIQSFLDKYGLKGKVIPAGRLKDLEEDLSALLAESLIDSKVRETYLGNFSFSRPDGLQSFESLVILSKARPIHRLGLVYKGKDISVLLPPTYVDYQKLNREVFRLFKDWARVRGHCVSVARIPLKLLSVRSGLAKYGRNNITYIGDWGSFHQLFGFHSSIKTDADPWQEIEALDACRTCTLCLKNCPTGAIRKDRFLLDAARCLTLLNESGEEIPPWVHPRAHNSLIGCMRCQDVCPYDSKVKDWIEDIGKLDQEETGRLLDYDIDRDRDSAITERVKKMGIHEFFLDLVPRNLRLLLR